MTPKFQTPPDDQTLLVGGDPERAPEIVAFGVVFYSSRDLVRVCLGVRNQLRLETATSVLHLLHHLSTGVCIGQLLADLHTYDSDDSSNTPDRERRLNPAIFDALRELRGGRLFRLHTLQGGGESSVFRGMH